MDVTRPEARETGPDGLRDAPDRSRAGRREARAAGTLTAYRQIPLHSCTQNVPQPELEQLHSGQGHWLQP